MFQRTESITRKFTSLLVIVSVFFMLLLGGQYISSRSAVVALSTLAKVNQLHDLTRQIVQLRHSFSEFLGKASLKAGNTQGLSLLKIAMDQDSRLFAEAIELSQDDQELNAQFIKAQKASEKFKHSLMVLLTPTKNRGAKLLISHEFENEANDILTKVQIALSAKSEHLFGKVYERRFTPLWVAILLTLAFTGATLLIGVQLTRRFNRSVKKMLEATAQVSGGNLDFQAEIVRPDEIGQLTNAFNEMTARLKETTVSKDELNSRNIALAAANKELEAFSYSVSHDLRAPLRGIDGFSQMLIEDLGPTLEGGSLHALNRIRSGVQRMGQLIDDMLNLSRLSRAEIRLKPIDLTGVAQDIFDELKKAEPMRAVDFKIAPHLKVDADASLLRIMLENLIGNAWKYTSKVPKADIEIGTISKNGRQQYFIRDNGAGFDMNYAQKLFGAFQRLHSADEFPGTGIGLAIVQRVLQRHGGAISAESEVGKGATFFFYFDS